MLVVAASKPDIYQMLCVQFELLMMGGKTACNMQSTDSNKEYCITLHLVVILEGIKRTQFRIGWKGESSLKRHSYGCL
jgi:hypothetical protein